MSNEPNDFGPRVAMRRWGSVVINPMPLLARKLTERSQPYKIERAARNARKHPHRGGKK